MRPLSTRDKTALWNDLELAAEFDPTLQIDQRHFEKMCRKFVPSRSYTRNGLFTAMVEGEPSLVKGYPLPLQKPYDSMPTEDLIPAIVDWFAARRSQETHRIFTGRTGVRRFLTAREIAKKWEENSTRFGVTDFYVRNTIMERELIDVDALNTFNLMQHSSQDVQEQELFSFVFSSRGHVTDSHSDAPDSTNYCFTGRKLWLGWDTYEGMAAGLHDVERIPISGPAKFDMEAWLSLDSARWLIVNPGDTLFMPANLTHKVITLDPYLGTGGFYVSLPNCLRSIAFWVEHVPLWSKRDSTGRYDHVLGDIASTVRETILSAPRLPAARRKELGYDFLNRAAIALMAQRSYCQVEALLDDERFRSVAEVIPAKWPTNVTREQAFA